MNKSGIKGQPDAVWVTDFNYLRCGEGGVNRFAICDRNSRRVLGYCMRLRRGTQLVVASIDKARELRGELPRQVVVHADRATQFTSDQLHEVAVAAGVRITMGKTGMCGHNAMAESFCATLKVEYFCRHTFATRAAVYDGISE